jgi:diguanylate cyclase (GGDEF)-like protein
VSEYGLVLQPDVGRAAQLARIVEKAGLSAILARRTEEAAFHVARSGAPALLLVELTAPGDRELQFLRDLRRVAPHRATPVIAIVDSRQMYETVARLMIELNVVSLLTRSRQLATIEATVHRVLGFQAASSPPDRVRDTPVPALEKAADPRARDEYVEALRVAERLADHPLVEQLANMRALEGNFTGEDLQRLVSETATVFRVPIALLWLEGRPPGFVSHPRSLPDPSLREGGGPWAAFRNALAEAPLHVMDCSRHRLLAKTPRVLDGTVRGFAGSPIRGADGEIVGAIALGDPRVGGVLPDLLDPLVFWALRIGSDLPTIRAAARHEPPSVPEPSQPAPPAPEPGLDSGKPSLRGVLLSVQAGILITDSDGTILYANQRINELLALGKRSLRGMRRAALLESLQASTDAPAQAFEELSAAALGARPHVAEIGFTRPLRRSLRWQSQMLPGSNGSSRLDELTDLTREAAQRDELEKWVRVDPLTELPNRRGGEEALAREIARCLRSGTPLSVALFEVDSLGVYQRPVADSILRGTAWLLRDALRGYDLAARHDTRQLLAILPGANAAQMLAFAERFRGAVERTALDGLPRVTVSGGVAEFDPAKAVDQLIADATAALVESRRQGGNVIL